MISKEIKAEALRLRTEEKKSLNEIHTATGISKGHLSEILRSYPLPAAVIKAKCLAAKRGNNRKDRGTPSKYFIGLDKTNLTRHRMGKISEAAVLFRLALNGFNVFNSVFDGERCDFLVEVPSTGKILKLQVKTAKAGNSGLPTIKLTCYNGFMSQRKYVKGEFDFIVGYSIFTDEAFVYSFDELAYLSGTKTVTNDAKEAWNKLLQD